MAIVHDGERAVAVHMHGTMVHTSKKMNDAMLISERLSYDNCRQMSRRNAEGK